ncbi:MAG TPA: hypothetical protein VIU61_13945, partial [Kofleriaceae bacterium]
VVGCASESGPPESALAFTITSSDLTLQPGEETTKCFYFHTPHTEDVVVSKWVSDMTPGSHHMIAYQNLSGQQPADGTIDDCPVGGGTGTGGIASIGLPTYLTQLPHDEVVFPSDDGAGKPLAQIIPAATAGYLQMHYFNTSDAPLTAHVTLSAYGLPSATEFTRTDVFVTFNADIAIPPHAEDFVVSATCDIADKKFWQMSTHAHKQAVQTTVKDGAELLFTSDNWEHPGEALWDGPTFYRFQQPQITWECTYDNTGTNADTTIVAGQSARTNEMCMAVGYQFPAVGPRGCIKRDGQCRCLL